MFYMIINWEIKRCCALAYHAPERLRAPEADGQLSSQRPLLSGVQGLPPKGSGVNHMTSTHGPSRKLPQAEHQPRARPHTQNQ